MSAPIIEIPTVGPIATRPRCDIIYDTQVYSSVSTNTIYPFFQNSFSFLDTVFGTPPAVVTTIGTGTGALLFFAAIPGGTSPVIPGPARFYNVPIVLTYTIGGVPMTATAAAITNVALFVGPNVNPASNFRRQTGLYTIAFTVAPDLGTPVVITYQPPNAGNIPPKSLLDTNLPGPGGSLPKGYYFRWFGLQSWISYRISLAVPTATDLDDKRKLWDSGYTTVLLGETPYMQIPFWKVVTSSGIMGSVSMGTGLATYAAGDVQMGIATCCCTKDMTIPGKIRKVTPNDVVNVSVPNIPIEFAETESWGINVTYPQRPTVANNPYIQLVMSGIMLKPLAA